MRKIYWHRISPLALIDKVRTLGYDSPFPVIYTDVLHNGMELIIYVAFRSFTDEQIEEMKKCHDPEAVEILLEFPYSVEFRYYWHDVSQKINARSIFPAWQDSSELLHLIEHYECSSLKDYLQGHTQLLMNIENV